MVVVDMIQSKLRQAIGSVKDQASIGKALIYNNNHHEGFCDIEIAVVRATGHDNRPIDDRYMHEILFLVSNYPGPGSIVPFLAERLSRRLGKTKDRPVALKTLLLIHRLLRGGNRRFEQQLRSAYVSGHLQMAATTRRFLENNSQHHPSFCFLHKYAVYLEERMEYWVINQAGKLEPIPINNNNNKSKSSSSQEQQYYLQDYFRLCSTSTDHHDNNNMVFRILPKCQVLLDKVLDCSPSDNCQLAQAAMSNTLKESFQVYTAFCEGVAALVNMLFDLTGPERSLACNLLKRASQQSQELSDFYDNCKKIIIGNKNLEYPLVQIIAMDHVTALEQLLNSSSSSYGFVLANFSNSSPPPPPPPPPPILLDYVAKSTIKCKEEGEKDEQRGENSLSSTLFSCTLETKISKVWVVFDDEEPADESIISVDRPVLPRRSHQVMINRETEHSETCSFVYPFTTCMDLSMVSNV